MPYLSEGTVAYGDVKEWTVCDWDNYEPMDRLWEVADRFKQEDLTVVSVDYAIDTLEPKKNRTEAEEVMLKMCKEAQAMGAADLSLY